MCFLCVLRDWFSTLVWFPCPTPFFNLKRDIGLRNWPKSTSEFLQHKGCCCFSCGYFIYHWSFSLVLDCHCCTHAHVTGRVISSAPGCWVSVWLQTFSGLSWSCISSRPSTSAGLWLPQQHPCTEDIVCLLLAGTFHLNSSILVLLFCVPSIIHVAFSWWIICISESDGHHLNLRWLS